MHKAASAWLILFCLLLMHGIEIPFSFEMFLPSIWNAIQM